MTHNRKQAMRLANQVALKLGNHQRWRALRAENAPGAAPALMFVGWVVTLRRQNQSQAIAAIHIGVMGRRGEFSRQMHAEPANFSLVQRHIE